MKIRQLLELGNVKLLIYLSAKGNARYNELLAKVVVSRSTLALMLRELEQEGLIERTVEATRPIQTRYSLSSSGKQIAQHLLAISKLIHGR